MSTIIETKMGGLYEWRSESAQIRRISVLDDSESTVRLSIEGKWAKYSSIYPFVGTNLVIMWPSGTPLKSGCEDDLPATVSSPIVDIRPMKSWNLPTGDARA
jgi:hypothetical protein